jgi:hypothetical protein
VIDRASNILPCQFSLLGIPFISTELAKCVHSFLIHLRACCGKRRRGKQIQDFKFRDLLLQDQTTETTPPSDAGLIGTMVCLPPPQHGHNAPVRMHALEKKKNGGFTTDKNHLGCFLSRPRMPTVGGPESHCKADTRRLVAPKRAQDMEGARDWGSKLEWQPDWSVAADVGTKARDYKTGIAAAPLWNSLMAPLGGGIPKRNTRRSGADEPASPERGPSTIDGDRR